MNVKLPSMFTWPVRFASVETFNVSVFVVVLFAVVVCVSTNWPIVAIVLSTSTVFPCRTFTFSKLSTLIVPASIVVAVMPVAFKLPASAFVIFAVLAVTEVADNSLVSTLSAV